MSKNFLQTLTKKYQETGDIRPLPQGGSPPSRVKLSSEELVILLEIMAKNNDGTNKDLCELLENFLLNHTLHKS